MIFGGGRVERREAEFQLRRRAALIERLLEREWLVLCSGCGLSSFDVYTTDALSLALEGQTTLDPNPTHLCRP